MTSRATALAFILALAVAPLPAQEPPTGDRAVYRVPVTGVIELGLAPFIERSLREAEAAGAVAVILDIDTPGGRVDAAERIVDAVSDATVPVYAYVNRRAFSAGAMIALSSREIHMRPGAVLGAATPVGGTGEKAPEKIVSAMRSTMRALAEARGLDPRVAEAMVDEDIAIPDVTEAGKLLTLTTAEAVQLGYARAVDDWDTLMLSIGATGAPVHETEVNWAERLVRFLTHPVVAPLLLSLGFFGVIIELRAPGLGLPGAVGVLALALFFGSHLLIGLAGLEAVPPFRRRCRSHRDRGLRDSWQGGDRCHRPAALRNGPFRRGADRRGLGVAVGRAREPDPNNSLGGLPPGRSPGGRGGRAREPHELHHPHPSHPSMIQTGADHD